MVKQIQDLIDVSREYGSNTDFVIAGGGNTSWKNDEHIWVKASGARLADITDEGFVVLDRKRLAVIHDQTFSDDPDTREKQVKEALYASCIDPESSLRPSVETSLHNIIDYSFVVHLHPTLVNAMMCGKDSKPVVRELFPNALYIEYTDPGYTLFMKVFAKIMKYRKANGFDPKIIFLENHGVFFGDNTIEEIRKSVSDVMETLEVCVGKPVKTTKLPLADNINDFIPALRMLFSSGQLKTCTFRNNNLISKYSVNEEAFKQAAKPFTPDFIVYCKSAHLFIEKSGSAGEIIDEIKEKLPAFLNENGYLPKIVMIRNVGLLAIGDTWQEAGICLDLSEDQMKIHSYSANFGGPRYMTEGQVRFIDNWEVENYRRKVAKGNATAGKIHGRTAIVTGGAAGFGAGIVAYLVEQGANVVIADLNKEQGYKLALELSKGRKNIAWYVNTDVSDPVSVQKTISTAIEQFGAVDLMISNAGILYAGSLEEMDPDTFARMTNVNYTAFFYCVKYAAPIMKLQSDHHDSHFSDIIQINSKSGLAGSNKNFAYAGGKFGGIGLTQSFALELMPHRIKVNAICPGNFFEGPLWSDPEKGLFVQYLETGKVPGAKTVDDVKKHYESMVPAKRGCRVEDVNKAISYIIEQEYETGQALPVTGGQIMLH